MNRKQRITSTNDFQRVRHLGKTYAHPLVVVIANGASQPESRVGIITSKSLGNAVKRNQARRRIRKILSDHLIEFIQPHDIVVVARPKITTVKYHEIEKAIIGLLNKAGIIG